MRVLERQAGRAHPWAALVHDDDRAEIFVDVELDVVHQAAHQEQSVASDGCLYQYALPRFRAQAAALVLYRNGDILCTIASYGYFAARHVAVLDCIGYRLGGR